MLDENVVQEPNLRPLAMRLGKSREELSLCAASMHLNCDSPR